MHAIWYMSEQWHPESCVASLEGYTCDSHAGSLCAPLLEEGRDGAAASEIISRSTPRQSRFLQPALSHAGPREPSQQLPVSCCRAVRTLVARAFLKLKRRAFVTLLARYWRLKTQAMCELRRQHELQLAKRIVIEGYEVPRQHQVGV